MTTQHSLSLSTVSIAVLATFVLASASAHAGLLGNGSAGLGGNAGMRGVDVQGQTRVNVQRDEAAARKVRETAGAVSGRMNQAKDTTVNSTVNTSAQVQADANATVQAGRSQVVEKAAAAKTTAGNTVRKVASTPVHAQAEGQTAVGDNASAAGSAEVTRTDRSVNASASGGTSANVGR